MCDFVLNGPSGAQHTQGKKVNIYQEIHMASAVYTHIVEDSYVSRKER